MNLIPGIGKSGSYRRLSMTSFLATARFFWSSGERVLIGSLASSAAPGAEEAGCLREASRTVEEESPGWCGLVAEVSTWLPSEGTGALMLRRKEEEGLRAEVRDGAGNISAARRVAEKIFGGCGTSRCARGRSAKRNETSQVK